MTEQEKKLVEAWLLVSDYCNSFRGGHEGCVFYKNEYCALNSDELTDQLREKLKQENAELPVLPIPVTKFVRGTHSDSQFKHIIEECGEVAKELRNGSIERAALELGDVVTSCFTMFEILGYGEAARSEIFRQTNEKNEIRGYFEAEDVAE